MDDSKACSSSGNDHDHLASIAGVFLSDNIRSISRPFRKLIGKENASKKAPPVLHPLRHSLAGAAASEADRNVHSRSSSSILGQEEQQTRLKHRLKPQVPPTLGLHSSFNHLAYSASNPHLGASKGLTIVVSCRAQATMIGAWPSAQSMSSPQRHLSLWASTHAGVTFSFSS